VTAAEVIDRIEASWQELTDLVEGLDDQTMSKPGSESWAIKDHLVHVGAWEHWLLALFEHRDKLAAMGAKDANRKVDDINAIVFENHRHDSAKQALDYFRDAHKQLMAVLRQQTTEDLERPYATFFASGEAGEGAEQPVVEAVAGNTYDHYPEHIEWIKTQTGLQARR
jgi:hypothetical protein